MPTQRFTLFRRQLACPICGSNDGRCKQSDSGLILCMGATSQHDGPPGFTWRGLTRDGTWGQWVEADPNNTSTDRADRADQAQAQRNQAEATRRQNYLSESGRDFGYAQLLDRLMLTQEDRDSLLARGFTADQIEAIGFRSVGRWQRIGQLPPNLPGYLADDKKLNTPYPGYLCPIRNLEGQIVGCQVRTRNPAKDEPKYYWLTSRTESRPDGQSPNLLNGELPLSIYRPQHNRRPNEIWLTEGTGPKPAIASIRHGVITVGAAGGQHAASPQQLLAVFQRFNPEIVIDCLDAGALANPHVRRQRLACKAFLEANGYQVRYAWWGQTEKGTHPDIDELPANHPIDFLPWDSLPHPADATDEPAPTPATPTTGPGLADKIRSLLESDADAIAVATARAELRAKYRGSDSAFDALWHQIEAAVDREANRTSNRDQLNSLLGKARPQFSLPAFLGEVGKPIEWIAANQNMRSESYLFAILAAIGGIAKNGTRLWLHRGLRFSVTPNLFFAIVAPSSQRKSPLLNCAVVDPLNKIQSHLFREYEDRLKSFKEDPDGFSERPAAKILYFNNPSGEAIPRQVARFPDQGLCFIRDELKAIFGSTNQYRPGGRGSDEEDLLEYYDGRGPVVLRVDGVKARHNFHLSIIGGIQPEVLRDLIGSAATDGNGRWARFIFLNQPVAPARLPERTGGQIDVCDLLAGIYNAVINFPAQEYELTNDAFEYFRALYDEWEKIRCSEAHPATASAIGKLPGRVGKLALCLHLYQAAVAGLNQPPTLIDLDLTVSATQLAELSLDEIKAQYADASDALPAQLKKIYEAARLRGEQGLSARDAVALFSSRTKNRPKTADVLSFFAELEAMGLGTVSGRVFVASTT